jgi:hypothetical protein
MAGDGSDSGRPAAAAWLLDSPFSRCVATAVLVTLGSAACATRAPSRPSAGASADPAAVQQFLSAAAHCPGLKTMTAELGLSGRAGQERLRGRVVAGLQQGGRVRLEGVAPFGPPIFILAGADDAATLLLPREGRVLPRARVDEVMERLAGLALGGDDLRLVLSGCVADAAQPLEPRAWPNGWKAVTLGRGRVAYLRERNRRWAIVAADAGEWRVDYDEYLNGFPRRVRIRTSDGAVDLTARVSQLEVNVPIDAAAFRVAIPSDVMPMTLDELKSVAPLRSP